MEQQLPEQQQPQRYEQQPATIERQLLFDTLRNLWQNYLNSAKHKHAAAVKQHWLQLFLFNFQFVDEHFLQDDEVKSFFNPIPEEICSYLLEQVYDIISESKLLTTSPIATNEEHDNTDESSTYKNENSIKLLRTKHNFTQLILNTPNDCNKIVALRSFLTNELGQHILEFLLKVDTKLIASQKSLCHLCINLFPNCNWSKNKLVPLQRTTTINDFISNFLCNKIQKKHKSKAKDNQEQQKQLKLQQINQNISIKSQTFENFMQTTKTSDEIALLLIQLLTKCIRNEHDTTLTMQSSSVTVLDFALNCLCVPPNDAEALDVTTQHNDEIIKLELLQLIGNCINNPFNNDENEFQVLNFNGSCNQLLQALVVNIQHRQLCYAVIYLMFGTLHNLIDSYIDFGSFCNIFEMHIVDVKIFDACFALLLDMLSQEAACTDETDENLLVTHIFKILLKLIDSLNHYEQLKLSAVDGSTTQHNHIQHKPTRRSNTKQLHCSSMIIQSSSSSSSPTLKKTSTLSPCCYFQGKLYLLLPQINVDLQEYSMRYLLRVGTCCCHYNLINYGICLRLALRLSGTYQKCAYKFLHYHILSTLFVRNAKRPESTYCTNCDDKLKSTIFHNELLQLYRKNYNTLTEDICANNGELSLLLFLKHLKHIAHLLSYDLSAGILAAVVLPIFRQYKPLIMTSTNLTMPTKTKIPTTTKLKLHIDSTILNDQQKHETTSIKTQRTLHECLNIFVMYLSDVRLIKAFYNEENIAHLEDLLSVPELQRGICDLIKIGIDNITFLGDNDQEQNTLSRRLITLQLNSSNRAAQLFHALLARCVKTNCKTLTSSDMKFWLDETAAATILNDHKPLDILYITALQWTLNFELLKTSQRFYNEFAKIYSIVVLPEEDEDDIAGAQFASTTATTTKANNLKHGDKTIIDILKLNYNALSCFLMLPSKAQATTTKLKISQSHQEINAINCSHSNSLETLLFSSISSVAQSTTSVLDAINYATVTIYYDNINRDTQYTFLQKLQFQQQVGCDNTLNDESIVLFDIRNQQQQHKQQIQSCETVKTNHLNCSATTSTSSNNSSYSDLLPTFCIDPNTHKALAAATATAANSNESSIIGKLFGMFGSLFGGGFGSMLDLSKNSKPSAEPMSLEIDEDLLCLYEANGESKKLLLKLFEATMAICIKGYHNEEVEKMHKHLRKLKSIILSNANATTSSKETNLQDEKLQHLGQQNVHEHSIIQTLQSLLRIAELSNTLNEPAQVVSRNNSSSILTTATTTTDDAMLTSTVTASKSLFRSRARSSLATVQSDTSTRAHQLRPLTQLPAKNSMATPPTPRRPVSGESGDADYFSTRASLVCPDSELEFSENDADYYLTADEGYEADGEIPEVSDSDSNIDGGCGGGADIWNSFQPTSRYRAQVMHPGLCRLVVDILIQLCELCTHNPDAWCDNLTLLANRLFVIRDNLGGPLFLLKGFTPVLCCNDNRLKELQQSILDLIINLNTPDLLQTFFSILATKNPPTEILIKYMHHIISTTLKKPQPSIELEFPIIIDGKCISTADPIVSEHIDRVRNYHLHCQATTPFTRAPCIIPVTHTRLWHNDGFTLSLWLEIKGGTQTHRSSMNLNEDDTRSSVEQDLAKTHIVSVGTNQAMLSIYINANMQLVFETCKPNAEIQIRTHQTDDLFETTESKPTKTSSRQNRKQQKQAMTTKTATTTISEPNQKTSPFRHALKQTKLVFLNSFSNGHHHNGETIDPYFENSYVDLKYFRLPKNKWTHLVFAVDNLPDRLDLTIYIDGLEQHTISLPFRNFRNLTRTHVFQMISLGDGAPATLKGTNNSSSCTESRSTLDGSTLRLNIANLMLFNRKISVRDCILNLTAMGPDFTEFTQCQVANWKPNYGYLNLSKMFSASFGNFAESMKLLRQVRVLSYTAQQPDLVMCYDNTMELDNAAFGRPYGLILYGELLQNQLSSLQTATLLCGGLSTLLYQFARVVECCNHSLTQSLALDILLSVAYSESELFTEFLRNDYLSLIGYVIKSERCTKDVKLLQSILNNACTQTLLSRKGDSLHVNEHTNAILTYPRLITAVLHRYSDWHRSGAEHSDVLDLLFRAIVALTREKHPHRDFNMEQLQKVGLVKEMLNICKVYVIESPNPVYISKDAAESFVEILSVFAGSPPSASLMDEIMKLLMLLHKPSECYITHDRAKFYFLLTAQLPSKERNTLNTSILSRAAATTFRRGLPKSHPGIAIAAVTATNSGTADQIISADYVKRQERIKRLRKLHASNSPYKRALNEFEENLENVADCSKLNKSALRLLSPIEASRWREKYKRHVHVSPLTANGSSSKSATLEFSPKKTISRKRLRFHSASSSARYIQSSNRANSNSKSSLRSLVAASLFMFGSETNINGTSTTAFSSTPMAKRTKSSLLKNDLYGYLGIMTLQERLLILLKDFLCLLPDTAVDEVLKHYVKLEFVLVLANNSSCGVRAAIIKLLTALTKRLPQTELVANFKSLHHLHLANQLTIYPTDAHMFEACIAWTTGIYGNLLTLTNCETKMRIRQRFGLNSLLAITTKMLTSQPELIERAFKILHRIYVQNSDEQQSLIEAGLLHCCMKALYNLYAPITITDYNALNYTKNEQSIVCLLTTIGEKSLKTVGQMTIVWDILNMLSFYQEKQNAVIVRCFRSVQAILQLNWINMYFVKTNVPWSFKLATLSDCTLSNAECRTRLDLLIDRCSKFFTIFEYNYIPSQSEINLFEFLVSYGIATNQRCNNFIAWGLQPSRPRDLRALIVDALWIACLDDYLPVILCDGKMIKSLLWLCLLEDLEKPIENLQRLCKRLGINENDSTWNLENELERIEVNRFNVTAKQKAMLDKTIYKFETLAQNCIESSMETTRRVAELQNSERKLLMHHMKDYDDTYTYTKWFEIIKRMTHEGAPWYCKERAENSWELDDTEGPSRVHTRLRRCRLDIDKRFFMEDYHATTKAVVNDSQTPTTTNTVTKQTRHNDDYLRPLDYLISSYDQQLNISLNSQILYNFPAKFLPVDGEIDGEIIITDHKLYFLATYRCKYFNVNCDISNITEIWLKRYQHQEKAFEIFLDTNKSFFFSLQNQEDWKIMRDVFCDKIITRPDQSKVLLITQQWRDGLLTNWEYLMTLNQIAGRTYNDLMQYPVFPWILSNYKTDILDLNDETNFRKLEKPIAVQRPENEPHYINNYTYIKNTMTNMGSITLKPYHYSSHYSNSGTVLHFLVRVPPFTSYFLRYQDNNFDLPDRTFHALGTTWSLASRDSPTDVKELIPEFFCLPEMFENFERFNFGCRQSGERVEDVQLPTWCQRDPRLFVFIHRQSLETEFVRSYLHNWIDLIFGFKQTGEAAVEAINVFHPATYAVFLESETNDSIERKAIETMVKTYGQMPRQLFKSPHPVTKALNYTPNERPILQSVRGLRWGVYAGSPQLLPPTLGNIHKLPGAEYLVSFSNTNVIYGLPSKSCVMQGAEPDTYNVISWGYDDRIIRIQPLNKLHAKPKNLLYNSGFDDITSCGCDANSNQLWFGHKSGRISVYKCASIETNQRQTKGRQSYVRGLRLSYNSAFRKITTKSGVSGGNIAKQDTDIDGESTTNTSVSATSVSSSSSTSNDTFHRDGADLSWYGPTVLVRHSDEITCITLSVEFKIAVTAGRDGIAVIWDLNDWSYVRTIERPAEINHSPITMIAISPTLGDIVTVHTLPWQHSDALLGDSTDTHLSNNAAAAAQSADECFEVTEENLDDFVNVSINPNGKSILRLHSVNARYVQHIVHEDRILAVCYSYIKEGVGVNVVATAVEGGIVRLWSSWNLNFITEIVTGLSNIRSITYSTHQHLVVLTRESHIQVWETDGLTGSSPKFPQIAYK